VTKSPARRALRRDWRVLATQSPPAHAGCARDEVGGQLSAKTRNPANGSLHSATTDLTAGHVAGRSHTGGNLRLQAGFAGVSPSCGRAVWPQSRL
jgi:hypothetical protein